MMTYDFVQLTFLARGGEIKGKTKLQKTVYFLGLATGFGEELGYGPHFYGPYSAQVADAVGRLKTLGFLDQTVAGGGAFDSGGFEVARYDYRLNDSGKRMAEAKAKQMGDVWTRIKKAVQAMEPLLDKDYMKLSIAAKTWFMLGEKRGQATMQDLAELAPRFGWSVTTAQIREAAELLQEAKLVTLTKE